MKPDVARPLLGRRPSLVVAAVVARGRDAFPGRVQHHRAGDVMSDRAGLVMNPDAKVKMRGVQVGKVASIEEMPDGQAALHLAMDPSQLHLIPSNVLVDIASTTVFGAKFVQLVPPAIPRREPLAAGQVLDAKNVTVEINTVFEQLTQVLSSVQPEKLNETLGRDRDRIQRPGREDRPDTCRISMPSRQDPSPASGAEPRSRGGARRAEHLRRRVTRLVDTLKNSTKISQTIVDEQHNLDAFLVSAIGLADIGNDVMGANRQALTDVLHLLVPTTDLTTNTPRR